MSKYAEHIARCNEYSQRGPEELVRTVTFVLATIQQQLEQVETIHTSMMEEGPDSRFSFGSKAKGMDWLWLHADTLYSEAMLWRGSPEALLRVFLQVPGLGLVKAGFACQLFDGSVGCLDTHNIRLYGVRMQTLRYPAKGTPELQTKYIQRYIKLCEAIGGSEFLWGRWCQYVADVRPVNWKDGARVSEYHCEVIGC